MAITQKLRLAISISAGTIRLLTILLICFLLISISANIGFSQSKSEKEKLETIKVKSDSFKRKKATQTASFTSKEYVKPTGSTAKERNRMSSFTGGNSAVRVKASGNNTSDLSKAAAYQDMKASKPGRNSMGNQISRNSHKYEGSVLVKSNSQQRKDARGKDRQMSKFEGRGLVVSAYKKQKDARRKSSQISRFEGRGLVVSAYKKQKDARKKSHEISQYRGDLIVKKQPKGAHPSAAWRGGKVKNTYQQKEKYRKRMMKRIGRNRNDLQPIYLRKKNRDEKPTYDSRESEIWSNPR